MASDAKRALVVFATTHGHTEKVARRIAAGLESHGLTVDLRRAGEDPAPAPGDYDLVVAGGSLHVGRHQDELADWVRDGLDELAGRPSCFFSVSLTAADDSDEARTATRECLEEFLTDTGWAPDRTATIAGCLQYREYDVFTRTLMRLKMKGGGHPTDTSQDHEYTDWDGVDAYAAEWAALVGNGSG